MLSKISGEVTFPLPPLMVKWVDLLKALMATTDESWSLTAEKTEAVEPFPNFLRGLNFLWKSL
jgi:hypothetical protein